LDAVQSGRLAGVLVAADGLQRPVQLDASRPDALGIPGLPAQGRQLLLQILSFLGPFVHCALLGRAQRYDRPRLAIMASRWNWAWGRERTCTLRVRVSETLPVEVNRDRRHQEAERYKQSPEDPRGFGYDTARTFRIGFHRVIQRCCPVPFGSRDGTAG
jgi:hypothetical protein